MPGKDLVFFVQRHIKPGCVEEWKTAVAELIDRMAQEAAFVSCLLDHSVEDPHLFPLQERWREPSLETFIANQTTDYRTAYEDLLPGLLQTPRKAMLMNPVRDWHR